MKNKGSFIVSLFFCMSFIAVLINGCSNTPKPSMEIGEQGIINCGGSICGLALTEEAWRENRKAERAGDIHGTAALMMAGKLTTVNNGTKVLVIDYNPGTALMQIRVLEGKGTGLSGWVPFERIIKQAPDNSVKTK